MNFFSFLFSNRIFSSFLDIFLLPSSSHFDAFGRQSIIAASKGGSNSNKMYRTQLLEQPTSIRGGTAANGGSKGVYLYNRFGRVGEVNGKNPNGEYTLDGPYDSEDAIKKFKSTFRTKFGNKWDDVCNDRDSFVKQKKRYVCYQF
tara:strand:+ start:334 stop:768 length:435 start_codon:yes stop_codon:yes gene_type:complete